MKLNMTPYEKMKEREKTVQIIFKDTNETFNVKKSTAIPIKEALRTQERIKTIPENTETDMARTAKILSVLSEIR